METKCEICGGIGRIVDETYRYSSTRTCPYCYGLGVEMSLAVFRRQCRYQRVRAFVYDADIHCPDCAYERFGYAALNDSTLTDSEGNPIGVVFVWTETDWEEDHCDCAVRAFVNSRARFAN